MAQGGMIGNGIRFAHATGSPQTWKRWEQVMDCPAPTLTRAKVPVTVHKDNDFVTSISGMATVSDVLVKMLKDPDPATSPIQNSLFALAQAKTKLWFRLEIPANDAHTLFTAYEWMGQVTDVKDLDPMAGAQELDVTVIFGFGVGGAAASLTQYSPMASLL